MATRKKSGKGKPTTKRSKTPDLKVRDADTKKVKGGLPGGFPLTVGYRSSGPRRAHGRCNEARAVKKIGRREGRVKSLQRLPIKPP